MSLLSGSGLPVALDDVFVGCQLRKAHGPACVEFLCRYSDLGAEAELAAVGERRGQVDIDAGGIHAAREAAGGILVFGDDGLAVA